MYARFYNNFLVCNTIKALPRQCIDLQSPLKEQWMDRYLGNNIYTKISVCIQLACNVRHLIHIDVIKDIKHTLVKKIELMLTVTVNIKGHVGTLPPFYGTFTHNEDVMTSNKCLKYNHPIKPQRLICIDGLT